MDTGIPPMFAIVALLLNMFHCQHLVWKCDMCHDAGKTVRYIVARMYRIVIIA